jgi:hypothetical protein
MHGLKTRIVDDVVQYYKENLLSMFLTNPKKKEGETITLTSILAV